MKMHSCFDCKFRKLPLKDTPCDKGLVEKGGLMLQCLCWQKTETERRVKEMCEPKDETWWEDMDWDAMQYEAEQYEESEDR